MPLYRVQPVDTEQAAIWFFADNDESAQRFIESNIYPPPGDDIPDGGAA